MCFELIHLAGHWALFAGRQEALAPVTDEAEKPTELDEHTKNKARVKMEFPTRNLRRLR